MDRSPSAAAKTEPRKAAPAKMSYKETRELELLPKEIEALEQQQMELTAKMSSGDYHKVGPEQMRADSTLAEQLTQQLEKKFERWSELESKRGG